MSWINDYLDHTLDITCLLRANAECNCAKNIQEVSKKIVETLIDVPCSKLIEYIDHFPITSIDVSTVPQFSDFNDSTIHLIDVLKNGPQTYEELGLKLFDGKNNSVSSTKYGENHAKLGTLLDLAMIREQQCTSGTKTIVMLSPIGDYISTLEHKIQQSVITKLCYRIEIIQQLIIHTKNSKCVKMIDLLSKSGAKASTIARRSPNVKKIVERLISTDEIDVSIRLSRIIL